MNHLKSVPGLNPSSNSRRSFYPFPPFRQFTFLYIFICQLAFKCPFQDRLPIDFELLLRGFEAFDAFIQTAEQFFYFGDNAVLLGEGWEG